MVAPLVVAAAVGTAKMVGQGVVLAGSGIATIAALKALSKDGGDQSQNVTALLAHLEQKEQNQTAFFLFDFEGGIGYFAVAAMIILIMVTCGGMAHCCGITPMARAKQAKQQALLAMLSTHRAGHRTSLVAVRANVLATSAGGNHGLVTQGEPTLNTNPGRGGGEVALNRRESSVIPIEEEDTMEKIV